MINNQEINNNEVNKTSQPLKLTTGKSFTLEASMLNYDEQKLTNLVIETLVNFNSRY